ncbi:MAG: 4-hydroxybenzoyl-CoA reductase subunit beta [Peptococcaceae bacterium]|jgi:4-hydroxybenzoyl-CoA reductase subunit beta|nr:4-hydroxybenzoyl-CoA reductase subunit beta [Peptococcaceae bacterium]
MILPYFTHHAPGTVQECIKILDDARYKPQILAGGSDLLVRMKLGLINPEELVSLSNIDELQEISYSPLMGLTIGAGVTLARMATDPEVNENCPVLARAAELVATTQIRNTATIGGNILQNTRCQYYNRSAEWAKAVAPCYKRGGDLCHVVAPGKRCFAVYQSDLAPILVALNASVTLVSRGNARKVELNSLYSKDGVNPFKDVAGQLMTQITIPAASLANRCNYKKYRLRDGIDYPLAGIAVALKTNEGYVEELRIGLTGVASYPVLLILNGENVAGRPLNHNLIKELGQMVYDAARPLPNLEGDPARRRAMTRILTEDILTSFMD